MRQLYKVLMVVPAVALLAACGREADKPSAAADALSRDLALAATAQPYGQQFVSPQELGYAQGQYPQPYPQGYPQPYGQPYGYQPAPYGQQPVYYPQPAPQQVVYRAPARTTSSASSSGRIYRAPAPAPTVKRNTKRDAMIGATAGAVMGSVIGRDVKGAVIGAAAGGLLGAVVGHTIDVERTP
ncbi:MAG TPA: YMGG-like glycine zipper-containing protein [Gemmatimonadaceae bacterium]|nr:YMGG-like glycine zipper-containing protein [Gemmatimonadaceae bacterium]